MTETRVITRADIEREARKLVGVAFKHQHSDPAVGLDCRGVFEWLGFVLLGRPIPVREYQRKPDGREFYEKLKAEMEEVAVEEATRGDFVLITLPKDTEARHGGVLVAGLYEPMIIHAFERFEGTGSVIEEPYRGWTRRRTATAFRFPGVVD